MTDRSDPPIAQPAAGRSATELRSTARLIVVGSGLLIFVALAPVAIGLAGAVALYEICKRPYARLARRVSRPLAAAAIATATFLLVAAPLVWLGYHLSTRAPSVVAAIDDLERSIADSTAGGVVAQIGPAIAKARQGAADWLPAMFRTLGGTVSWALLNWSIALLGLYYLLLSAAEAWQKLKRALPFSSAGAETLRVRLQDTCLAIVAGTLLSAAVQGASIGFGFFLAGIPEALFWAVCAAIATLVPLVGNALVWFPALLFTIITRRYEGAIAIALLGGLAPPLIDRVVRATVSRRMGRVHPMTTLVGALAGIQVAGVAGLILGPVALDMFFALVEVYSQEYLETDAG